MNGTAIRAVFWDFGGVVLSSPFEALAAYEAELGLPHGFVRTVNSTNPNTNGWSQLERGELDVYEFAAVFEAEARAHDSTGAADKLDAVHLVTLLDGEVRPEMVAAIDAVKAHGITQACLTNNHRRHIVVPEHEANVAAIMARFDHVVESSKVGVRKPEPRFYELACETVGVDPHEVVFLDDLGINLKPAKALGMTTIKVQDPADARADLAALLGFPI